MNENRIEETKKGLLKIVIRQIRHQITLLEEHLEKNPSVQGGDLIKSKVEKAKEILNSSVLNSEKARSAGNLADEAVNLFEKAGVIINLDGVDVEPFAHHRAERERQNPARKLAGFFRKKVGRIVPFKKK